MSRVAHRSVSAPAPSGPNTIFAALAWAWMTVVTSPMSEVMMTRPPVTVNSGFVLMPVIAVTPEVTRWPYSVLKNAARGLRTDMSASYQATRDDLRLRSEERRVGKEGGSTL